MPHACTLTLPKESVMTTQAYVDLMLHHQMSLELATYTVAGAMCNCILLAFARQQQDL